MFDESIKPSTISHNSLAPSLNYVGTKQGKITFTHGKTVNIYIVYEKKLWDRRYDNYPTLENSLFGTVKLVENTDIDKYKYSGYGIVFDRRKTFAVANGFGKNVIFFGVDMSSSVHVDNKKKYILILGKVLHKDYMIQH